MPTRRSGPRSSATSSTGSTRPRRSRSSSPPSTSARSASASRAPSRPSRSSTRSSSAAADDGLDGAVIGMAHRGRLNVLANIVGKRYDQLFKEFEGYIDPDSTQGSGDVKYHLGQTRQVRRPARATRSPSSWRPTRPTSRRSTRSSRAWCGPSRTCINEPEAFSVLPILLHGDAAFAGQGVVAETLNLLDHQGLPGRRHDPPRHQQPARVHDRRRTSARSSEYCTDVAKMVAGADLPRERRRSRGVRAGRRGSPSPTASGSTRTSSSTWSATAATVTTRATTRATRSRSCTSGSTPGARCASSTPSRS